MVHSRRMSSQEVGNQHCEKLEKWIADTPSGDIPLNYHGTSAKTSICRLLGISPSTIGTNNSIREAFDKLDNVLLHREGKVNKAPPIAKKSASLAPVNVPQLFDEIDSLKREVARLRFLTHTGQWIEE